MQNQKIAPQLAPLSADTPKFATAHVLPADIKISGKNVQEIKAEAQSAADEFAANLKDGLEKETKKGENKTDLAAQALAAQNKPVLLLDPKTGKAAAVLKEEKTSGEIKAGAKKNLFEPANAEATSANAKEVQAQVKTLNPKEVLAAEHAQAAQAQLGKVATPQARIGVQTAAQDEVSEDTLSQNRTRQVALAPKSSNLNPLQEMLLNQQLNPQVQAVPAKGAQAKVELAQALQASEQADPHFAHAFEIESLGVGAGAAEEKAFSEVGENSSKREAISKGSTSDFLSLRDLTKQNTVTPIGQSAGQNRLDLGTAVKAKDGKKDKLESLGGKEALAGGSFASHLEIQGHGKTMDAAVTTGSAGKTVMTHDAIHEMTKQVNLLSQARQDGEIKIRLRPDHLGELHMSVKTQGQQVSLEIKAQNNESKKIIEESLASLKDSLAGQSLTLARVDVVSAPTHAQLAADQGAQFDMSQFRQNSGGQNSGREFEQNGRNESLYEEMSAPVNLSSVRRANQSATSGRGLDLIA